MENNCDIDGTELFDELKFVSTLLPKDTLGRPLNVLNYIKSSESQIVVLNIWILLRMSVKLITIAIKKLPQEVLNTLAHELPNDWKKLARRLDIGDKKIDCVLSEFNTAFEQTYQILNSWIRKYPNKVWKDIKNGLVYCERNDVIDKCERKLSLNSMFRVQPSMENFHPRKKELDEIHRCLVEKQDKKKPLVLCGMSGVGKTQIARKYCEEYRKFYENIIWIDAAFGKLSTSVEALYQKLDFVVEDSKKFTKNNSFDIIAAIEKIHNYFKNENTLYIFDNIDNESVRNFKIYISTKPKSFTLITTLWRTWSNNVNLMSLDVFSPEDALVYMKNNIKTNSDEKLRELIKELGFHPFAITQAIKYINAHSIAIEKYLYRYRLHPVQILDDDKFPNEEESMSAVRTINLVLMKLENDESISLKLLNCLSHCDGQNISKHFIVQISKYIGIKDEYLVDDAIRLLVSYSLLDYLDDEKYSMHDLTQLSCKYFQSKNSSTKTFHSLMENYFRFELKDIDNHVDYGKDFVFHFLKMFRKNKKSMTESFHRLSRIINKFLTCKGLFQEVIEILKAVQSFNAETYGENNELTLETNHNIAICLSKMGKCNEALEIYYSVDKIQTETLGNNHPSTIGTKNNIATCLSKMGKYNEALEIYYSVDKIQTETLGINHPSTMSTKNNIATCLSDMGKYNEALEIYYSVDKIQTETLGNNHPSTIGTKNNIATCLSKMGKYNEALEIYYSVDKIQTETLGNNHPSTIGTKNNIATCLSDMGKYNEALEIYYSVDKIQTETLGNNHPSTIGTKNNIATCLSKMGKYNEALEILYSVDKITTETLGINHPLTMLTKNNIANCLRDMGKYIEALEIYYSVDKIQTETLDINHPSIFMTKLNIALCLISRKEDGSCF
nr:uncharacterized protein LOC124814934 [Hydra vulgaris]